MAIETGSYISDLVATNPTSADPKSQGDDHIRLLKSAIKTTFPNVAGAVTPTHLELNYVAGVTSALQTQLNAKAPKDTATFTGNTTLPATTVIGSVVSLEITYLSGVTSSIQTQLNAKAPTASPTFTGAVTLPVTVNPTDAARKDYVDGVAFAGVLPAQSGNAGMFVTTDGTTASWGDASAGTHLVAVHTGNGRGSSNTAIPRFTTTLTSVGTAISYADSATLGASFVINENGIYEIHFRGIRSGMGADYAFGISKNSALLSTSIVSISASEALAIGIDIYTNATAYHSSLTRVVKLSAGDVIRPHTELTDPSTTGSCFFSISKVAK